MSDEWKIHAERLPKHGDERTREVIVRKGESLGKLVDTEEEYVAKYDVYIEVIEVWTKQAYGRDWWEATRYLTRTIRPVPVTPTTWQRLKNWLTYPKTNLPKATVL